MAQCSYVYRISVTTIRIYPVFSTINFTELELAERPRIYETSFFEWSKDKRGNDV